MKEIAVLVLGEESIKTARSIQDNFPSTRIYGLAKRTSSADFTFTDFAQTCQTLFKQQLSIVGICSAGILIRSLAPILGNKIAEPPVIAISEDGSVVVPLLGGVTGAHELAIMIAEVFQTKAAITSNGTNRFKTTLLSPLPQYKLLNSIEQGKEFLSDLLAGATVKINGEAAWLNNSNLPLSEVATHTITITDRDYLPDLSSSHLAYQYIPPRGKLSIVGIGAGSLTGITPQVKEILRTGTDIVGYQTYIKLVEPLINNKIIHSSDNRQELDRAKLAINLAQQGRSVVVISSGDAGIFGMASAVLEIIDQMPSNLDFEINISPGISAVQTLAAKVGAPIGHDFCVISLSDQLKPWSIIEQRLRSAAAADFVIALYNPASLTRREQLEITKQILLEYRASTTPVVVGKNLDRTGEEIEITSLEKLDPKTVNMQTILIVGSSKTKIIRQNDREWVYTPRSFTF